MPLSWSENELESKAEQMTGGLLWLGFLDFHGLNFPSPPREGALQLSYWPSQIWDERERGNDGARKMSAVKYQK